MKAIRPLLQSPLSYRLALLVAPVLAAGVFLATEAGYRVDQELEARRELATETRVAVNRLRRLMLAMEAAQRGYMLSARPEYRQPYDDAQAQAPALLKTVDELAQRRPEHRESLTQLAEVARGRASELEEVKRLFEGGERERALTLTLTGIGREQMERMDKLADGIIAKEDVTALQVREERGRVRTWTLLSVGALLLLCLAAVLAAMRQVRERERERVAFLDDLHNERDKLEGEVERRTSELSALARHLQTVREDERRRLAREMHDELGGLLTAAKLDVARVRKRLQDAPPELLERVKHLSEMLDAGIALKRRIIEDLSPSSLANLGLRRTLEMHCADFARRAEVKVDSYIDDFDFGDERDLAVFRFVQEALTNVAKYARASRVRVRLARDGEQVEVQVHDDGVGFDTDQVLNGSHGIAGMRFRVQSCGGEWLLRSTPGGGTLVQARLPV